MQMEHARQNKKRANKGRWYHGLAWRPITGLTIGSTTTRATPANTLPQEQGAKFTEMAMHENSKANRVGLTQNIEAAT